MAQKFIINDDIIIIGNVELHRELARDHRKTVGGGYWHFDKPTNTIYLYGKSEDFGPVTRVQVEQSWCIHRRRKTHIVFSTAQSLNTLLKSINPYEQPQKAAQQDPY